MEKPTECKYCGCRDVSDRSKALIYFRCGTGYWPGTDQWSYANKCVGKCAEQLVEMRVTIQRAIEELKKAERYTVTAYGRNQLDWDRNPDGSVTDSVAVDEALAILEGERDD